MKQVILYGAGNFGKQASRIYGDRVAYFSDKTRQGEEIDGIPVIGIEELKRIHRDYEVIVTPIEEKARGEIGMELRKEGIPFSYFRSMHGLLHIYGSYPEIFYEYESSTMDFRMERTLDNYRDMFLGYAGSFCGKSLDIWIWEFDEAFAAFECMRDMGLSHIHGYATMFPVRDQVIPIPDYYACCKEETYPYDFSPDNCRKAAGQPWKDSRCFWRGNIFTNMENRSLLWLMGQKHPGALQYRSLRFETEVLNTDNYQGVAGMNYTDSATPYTRIVEHKHFAFGEGNASRTVITREYPQKWEKGMEAYYPVNDGQNARLYQKYRKLGAAESNVMFAGRLGLYRYMDMDQVVVQALSDAENFA